MTVGRPFQESLVADDFLRESFEGLADWNDITDAALDEIETAVCSVLDDFPTNRSPNESQTEDERVRPVPARLGWTETLR